MRSTRNFRYIKHIDSFWHFINCHASKKTNKDNRIKFEILLYVDCKSEISALNSMRAKCSDFAEMIRKP